jgi:hypothetical protein
VRPLHLLSWNSFLIVGTTTVFALDDLCSHVCVKQAESLERLGAEFSSLLIRNLESLLKSRA